MEEAEVLLNKWLRLKKTENKAKEERIEIERSLASDFLVDFDGQSKTFKSYGFKISVKKNIRYSFDQEKWISARKEISSELRPEKIKFEVDVKGFEFMRKNKVYCETFKFVSDCVTIKENKPTIKIEKE